MAETATLPGRTSTRHTPVVSAPSRTRHGRRTAPTPRHVRRTTPTPGARGTVLLAGGLGLLALALRLVGITDAYNVFIDEATYAAIARSVAAGEGVLLHGEPFILHPPLGFLMMGAVAALSGLTSTADLVLALRPAVAVAGALVVVVVVCLLRSAGRHRAAVAVGLLLALDPFGISFDSRVMLEAIAQVLAVSTVATAAMTMRARSGSTGGWALLTATFGAATFVTKETFGLVVVLALLLAAFSTTTTLQRRWLLRAVGGSILGYAGVNLLVVGSVGLEAWWVSRTSGLARLVGTHQPTGFSSPDSEVTVWSRVAPNAGEYGLTYLVLVAGAFSGAMLLLAAIRRTARWTAMTADHRATVLAVGAWTVASCAYVAYAVLFGSLEEQMFYIALAPCAASLVLVVDARLSGSSPAGAGPSGRGRRAIVAALVLVVVCAGQAAVWLHVRTTPDAVHTTMLAWVQDNVEPGSRLAVTEETAQFLIEDQQLGEWSTLAELRAERVDYVLVSPNLVEQGYAVADAELLSTLRAEGELVLHLDGRRSDLELYDVRPITGGSR